ncbi:BgtA-21244 [Blumeria graminis f. sp. tritici]|uniref:BgtA-21244 n=2 Tax=Blumeria graminis f. sp. tritici TaxID=62690 RepID=A0A9X9MK31_BLUGR|nr:hypothetical protein BGT96224_A21244 [Blumeria graminis f. sp. tritici 96224]VDB90610.1 BgtA-21244 [Blumeria graminis f. sp. tritici]
MLKPSLTIRLHGHRLCDPTLKFPHFSPFLLTIDQIPFRRQKILFLRLVHYISPTRRCERKNVNGIFVQGFRLSSNASQRETKLQAVMQELEHDRKLLLSQQTLPSNNNLENFFEKCIDQSRILALDLSRPVQSKAGATSALLALDNSTLKLSDRNATQNLQLMINSLSELAYSVIKNPKVFISPVLLDMYVSTQANLGSPETLPEVFKLYAQKPIPRVEKSIVQYSQQNAKSLKNAIPSEIAQKALETAIKAGMLVVALDIIEISFTTRAFKASKVMRKAMLPASGLALSPLVSYSLALQLANWQTTMDTAFATRVAFLGITGYIGLTSIIGLLTISTANDQMDRVTWAPGMPLWHRWIREEERAAIDRVAGAWGFRESWRRGEEEGEDWELIKEWVNRRDMILDKVELMEGMD